MRYFSRLMLFLVIGICATASCAAPTNQCPLAKGVTLQILGSGGPIADDSRASAGYLVWLDGQSRVLIDAGGGSILRFAEAGASFTELDFVGLSHFHIDHSVDFVALLKSGNFSGRERPLRVAGPNDDGPYPGLSAYLDSLLDGSAGAYGYMSGYLDGGSGRVRIDQREVGPTGAQPVTVYEDETGDFRIDAMHVPHGIVPALGFRVHARDAVIVFASDQNGSDPAFIDFAAGADILVTHMAIPEGTTGVAASLHVKPSRIGEIASEADVAKLVLSHFMARSLRSLDENVGLVRNEFGGNIVVAEDLACVNARP